MSKPIEAFTHQHAGHCESGVMSTMLSHHGLPLSEPMVFGLSSALNFAYLPFIKLAGMPLIAYRSIPKAIIKGLQKNIGVKMKIETFSSVQKGQDRLDTLLAEGKIVGAQTSVYWLPYLPEEMRFHFNGHNLLVYGKEDKNYKISDPVFEHVVEAGEADFAKARFAKGVMAPKGAIYYPTYVPEKIDYERVVPKVVKTVAKRMLKTPVPIAGLKGIHYLAKSIRKLETKDRRYTRLFLGHIVRMQEEIGTGGAGFRYIYASFLQESGHILNNGTLLECSEMMTAVGDSWREFALLIAKAIRSKKKEPIDLGVIADKLDAIADEEALVYEKMLTAF